MVRFLGLITITSIISLLLLAHPIRANAQEDVPHCSASLNDVEILPDGTTRVEVSSDEALNVTAAIPEESRENVVYLEFLGQLWELDRVPSGAPEWTSEWPVEQYARWGNGLYRVVWRSLGEEDTEICQLAATINVEGSLLGSAIGIMAMVALVVSLTGLLFTMKTVINEGGRWAIKVLLKGKLEREEEGSLEIRPSFSVSQTLLGTMLGLVLAGATLTTLQQAAVSLPTLELALGLAIPFALLGALAGSFKLARVNSG